MKFNEKGEAIAGTWAIAVATLVGAGEGGKPIAMVESAICDVCGGWADRLWSSGRIRGSGDMLDSRTSRHTLVVAYACPRHSDEISESLMDEFGYCSGNSYAPDALAVKVSAHATAAWEAGLQD